MLKNQIKVGGLYLAKVSGVVTTVRVDAIREVTGAKFRESTVYDVTNLRTGRKTTFRSAAKFRGVDPVDAATSHADRVSIIRQTRNSDLGAISDCILGRTPEEASEGSDPTLPAQGAASPSTTTASADSGAPDATAPVQAATTGDEQRPDPTSAAFVVAGPAKVTVTGGIGDLASRIAATRVKRTVGTPVAGMVPNEEQEGILAAAIKAGLRVLVIGAGAGTGKTATLKMMEQVLPGRGQYTAFNTSLVAESKAKFQRAACNTTHSLAFRAVGKQYQHRLGGERMRSSQIARILGIDALPVTLKGMGPADPDTGLATDKVKVLQADFLAGQVLTAIRRFCQSADRQVGEQHFRYIDGIDADYDGRRGVTNNDRVREYLLHFARKAWDDLSRVDGQLPFSHDCYVKLWQLGTGNDRPVIAADYILLDEAQDTAPVFLDVLKQQTHAMLVFVGDSNQAIYEWRGAVDAMKAYPDAERRLLSQSYRFGQAIADVANAVLATLEEPTDLVMRGMPGLPSQVAAVAEPRCYLYRTNAGAVGQVMSAIADGKKPHLIGGGADVVAWCQAAIDLQAKRGTRHPELACFESWGEVVEYSKTDEGSDLRLMVKLVTDFGAEEIRDALRDMPKEEDADLVVSTAHKSKGREWDTVKLGQDFPLANKMSDADRRLLYVAATRAKMVLDITECPPFCGGNDTKDTGNAETSGAWVPGIPIAYTAPMPTADEVAAYTPERAPSGPAAAPIAPPPATSPPPLPSAPAAGGNGNGGGEYTWANMDGGWCVRGPKEKVGQQVRVVRRNGTSSVVTLRGVTRKIGDLWFYTV